MIRGFLKCWGQLSRNERKLVRAICNEHLSWKIPEPRSWCDSCQTAAQVARRFCWYIRWTG